jgi:RimJ/RimL family protein N-acetyltransferase
MDWAARRKGRGPEFLTADGKMNLEATILEDRFVRLEPLGEAHREALRAACAADREVWTALYPYSLEGAHFDPGWVRMYARPDPARISFAVVAGGVCQGVTSYLAIDPVNATVEIGGTYIAPGVRGGAVNPAAKRLLLGDAFARGARRVSFRVDALNARSRAAVLKLGALQEAILRRDRVTWTGRVRDTVVFSVIAEEWPDVQAGLDARLAKYD